MVKSIIIHNSIVQNFWNKYYVRICIIWIKKIWEFIFLKINKDVFLNNKKYFLKFKKHGTTKHLFRILK